MKKKISFTILLTIVLSMLTQAQAQTSPLDYLFQTQGLDPAKEYFKMGYNEFKNGDRSKALDFWIKAHNAGSIDATYWIGECLFNGWGTEQNPKKGFEYIQYAANNGQVDACYLIGVIYGNGFSKDGIEIQADLDRSIEWLNIASEKNHSAAQWKLGDCYYIRRDYTTAFKWYKRSADQNNPMGIKRVGTRLLDGDGVEQNLSEAEKHLNKAKQMGLEGIDFILGKLYYHQNRLDLAISIFKELISTNSEATRWLGSCYAKKVAQGYTCDYNNALKYWENAASSGELGGMFYTSLCYYEGLGCEKNYNEAVKLFQKILDSTNGSIQLNDEYIYIYGITAKFLSNCFRYGRGIDEDLEIANELLRFAKETGYADVTIKEVMANLKQPKH